MVLFRDQSRMRYKAGVRKSWATEFRTVGPQYGTDSCHRSRAKNLELAPRLFENLFKVP
jgi:hypothetical protein